MLVVKTWERLQRRNAKLDPHKALVVFGTDTTPSWELECMIIVAHLFKTISGNSCECGNLERGDISRFWGYILKISKHSRTNVRALFFSLVAGSCMRLVEDKKEEKAHWSREDALLCTTEHESSACTHAHVQARCPYSTPSEQKQRARSWTHH